MKLLKRSLCLLLAAITVFCLCTGALAANVKASNQGLKIDDKAYASVAFNIDGNNYFKLRDIAMLMNQTASRFSVAYDSGKNAVTITKGASYTPVGGELTLVSGSTKNARPSRQTVYIDGVKTTNLTAYNIEGNNYFKLRDLGPALGFDVNYDAASRTMLVTTGVSQTDGWAPDISFTTTDMNGNTWTDAIFKDYKLTMINLWAYWCGPCVGEMPDLEQLSKDYADKGLLIIGMYETSEEQQNKATVQNLGITYPCLRKTSAFSKYLDTGSIPATIFVDSNGKVLGKTYVGSRSYKGWASIIESYLP